MQEQVTIRNDKINVETTVPRSSAKHFEKVGWTVVDDGSSESEQASPKKKAPAKKTQKKEG